MNKTSTSTALRIAVGLALAFLTVSCSTPAVTRQDLSPEEKKMLHRWALKELSRTSQPYCWRDSYGRGVGVPVSACPEGQEKDAGLCYRTCEAIGKEGWKGVGPVCWQRCPTGFRDDGAYCFKPGSYGRGVGFPWKAGDKAFSLKNAERRCEAKHGTDQCEKSGASVYLDCCDEQRYM